MKADETTERSEGVNPKDINMTRSIQQWAADAVNHVQFACNLSGLIFAFEQCVADLAAEAKRIGEGDEWINTHPICVLWIDKFDDLSRSRSLEPMQVNETLPTLVTQFAEVMRQICDEANRDGHGTDWRNQHPRAQEFVRKLVAVSRSREGINVFEAFQKCEQLARQQSIEEKA